MTRKKVGKSAAYNKTEQPKRVPALPENFRAKLGTRIASIADTTGGKRALAAAIGVHETQLYRYIRGENEPTAALMVLIARAAGVNLEWLATGDGPMRVGEGAVVAPLDRELLCLVIEEIERLLNDVNGELEPEKKAELIALIYEEVREQEGKVDRARVLRLIKLAS